MQGPQVRIRRPCDLTGVLRAKAVIGLVSNADRHPVTAMRNADCALSAVKHLIIAHRNSSFAYRVKSRQ
jgi:hypothetical protein